MQEPGFWDDSKKAEEVTKKSKLIKDKIENYDKLKSQLDDIEVLKDITATQITEAYIFNESGNVCLNAVDATDFIFIDITLYSLSDQCRVVIQGSHTNVTEVYINNINREGTDAEPEKFVVCLSLFI